MITVKEYAESRSKSIQAVHQQRKRAKYKDQLSEHEFVKDGVVYLDEVAVKILDSAHENTVAIVDTSTKERIQKLERKLEATENREKNLLNDLNKKNTDIINLQKRLQEQTEQITILLLENKEKTLLLEKKDEQKQQIDEQKQQIKELQQEKKELQEEMKQLKATNDQLVKEKESQSKSEGQNEPKKGFFARLFGR